MNKIILVACSVTAIGIVSSALAQNAPLPSGVSNAPSGTTRSGPTPVLPPSPTGTAHPSALDGPNASAELAATRYKFEQAGFRDVKGLTRSSDGSWYGRGVRGGVEVGVAMDPAGNITTQ